jgi:trehalose 6-phosphate synthase/phosphatase
MLGVDRLDMIKGIPQKLLAFEMFLEKHPEWREKVLLVQIAVPTRTDVPECRLLIQFCWKYLILGLQSNQI